MPFQKKSKKGKANAKRSNMALALVRAQQTAHDTVKQVFLGGSCNPTTWRKDIAIPILEAAKITYYNPQVDEWTPDLMQIEAHAKRDAEMLFYVVDANTRAVASMNEVVECICRNRKIVLVVQNMEASNELTRDEAGSEALLKDLNRGRDYLRDIARRNAVRCHETVEDGIEEVVRRLKPDFIYNKPGIHGRTRKRMTGQSMSNRKIDIHGTPSSKTKRRRSSVGFIAQSAPAMHEPRKVNAFRTQHAQFASDVLRSSTRRSMSQRRLRQAQQTPSPSEGTSMRRLPEDGQAEE